MDIITELKNLLKGRSNIISKFEIENIIKKYESKSGWFENKFGSTSNVPKDFWNFGNQNNDKQKGLIPSLIEGYKFKKQFNKSELEELEKIKKESFMKRFRELAELEGKEKAEEEFKKER
jgi:hypothetical protein